MDKILVLFLIGIAFGVLVPFAEKANQTAQFLDEPLTVIEHIFVAGAGIWHLAISVLILISLPASVFKSIRNRLSKKQFLPIPFMTGLSFGFTFMAVLGLIASSL